MGNGIKMRSAVDGKDQPYTVETLQAAHDAKQSIPDLLCLDPSCRKAVRFVPRHQQNRKNRMEPIDVPAYIGLTSGSKHADGCRFDASKRIGVIVDASDKDFIAALEDGKRELRLLVLHNGLSGRSLSGAPVAVPGTPAGSGAGGTKQYTASGNKLDSYLRTTANLLELRELCESDALLASQLSLRFGTKRIAWDNFFFEQDRFDDAWELMKKTGSNAHPIALVGEVRTLHSPPPGAKYKSSFLNCHSRYRKTDQADIVDTFEVSVMHNDAGWLASFPPGTNIIMFGLWEYKEAVGNSAKDPKDATRMVTYVTHKLTLRPKFKQQVLQAF